MFTSRPIHSYIRAPESSLNWLQQAGARMSKIGNIVVAMDTVQETHVSFHDFALILI